MRKLIRITINALLKANARPQIYIAATHGLFMYAGEHLSNESINKIFVTDTVLVEANKLQLEIVSIAPLIAQTIRRMSALHYGERLN